MKMPQIKFNLNTIIALAAGVAFVLVIIFVVWWNKEIVVNNALNSSEAKKNSIAGLACANAGVRPVAVMLASDAIARPLSGIAQADMVFEMPVTPDGITRMMAVFQCEKPGEIGSVRSARNDFIPLAASLKAIYAHWGGEQDSLAKLDSHVIDNVDALKYEGTTFYRKAKIPAPHNGFTNLDLIFKKAGELGYSLNDNFSGYPHQKEESGKNLYNLADQIGINYTSPNNVAWTYDQNSNTYARARGGTPEVDKDSNKQVRVSVVVVMETTSSFFRDQYINVATQGAGDALIYQNGAVITGKWKKAPGSLDSKLYFYDGNGKEAEFVPGKIWVEIVTE